MMTAKTPLYNQHLALNAKMVEFHGWIMPLHYGSQLDEHHHVRNTAGVFDVSHMTIIDIQGTEAHAFVRYLLAQDVAEFKHQGRALYTCMCNETGGIIDDLIVYTYKQSHHRLIFNAATRDRVISWLNQQKNAFAIDINELTNQAILAVQGPKALDLLKTAFSSNHINKITQLRPFDCVAIDDYFFARTGYTGEDGLEIIVPKDIVSDLWEKLVNSGIHPCGLGARDTLRLEAGLLLSGQDMDESTTPFESGLNNVVGDLSDSRNFIGKSALLSQQHTGLKRKLVGLSLEDQGIMRNGQEVLINEQAVGVITSGTYSPTLKNSIALARVPIAANAQVQIMIRNRIHNARIVKRRFIK